MCGDLKIKMLAPEIDDLSAGPPRASNGCDWELISDGVMGGRSRGTLRWEAVAGRRALRMQGDVSLENNGGFIQVALDLARDCTFIDAPLFEGIQLDVFGNDETYNLHLRTADVVRPWQSYRQSFSATPEWTSIRLPFAGFEPHRLEVDLDLRTLRRLGIVAIGRAFSVDVAIAGLRFYGGDS